MPSDINKFKKNNYSDIFVLNLNKGFLGDKILYEPILREINYSLKDKNIIGIEWSVDPISFMEFPDPPVLCLILHEINTEYSDLVGNWLKKFNKQQLISFATKDSRSDNNLKAITSQFEWINLWKIVKILADKNVFPRLNLVNLTNSEENSLKCNYITLHIRSIKRDENKNLDEKKYIDIAKNIYNKLNIKVLLVGTNIEKEINPNHPGIIDFRGKLNTIAELSLILKDAVAHIGGDTGPTHLASSLGVNVISVENTNSEYHGPFNYPRKIIRLERENSNSDSILKAINKFRTENSVKEIATNKKLSSKIIYNISPFLLSSNINRNSSQNNIKCFGTISNGPGSSKAISFYHDLFKKKNSNNLYIPIRVNNINKSIDSIKKLNLSGFSVSRPFKEDILKYCEFISDECKNIRASNTIVNIDNKWHAFNTDWKGAIDCLKNIVDLKRKSVLVFGSGGVSKAICYGLFRVGSKVYLLGRSEEELYNMFRKFNIENYFLLNDISHTSNLLNNLEVEIFINATPLFENSSENINLFTSIIPRGAKIVLDVTFETKYSVLYKISKRKKIIYIGGWEMLKKQAIYQVELFNKR